MRASTLNRIADRLLNDDGIDYIDGWRAMRAVLSDRDLGRLASLMEICPTHECAEEICADDEAGCPAGRGE